MVGEASMKHVFGLASTTTLSDVQEQDIQPNAVDLRVDRIFRINNAMFEISNDSKFHRGSVELFASMPDGYFELQPGTYEVIFENIIKVGEDEAGWVITRSTLNRNGLFLTSGLYDSGYSGQLCSALHVNCGLARIKKGTRIGQYISFKAEALHKYEGSYGLSSEHDKKYNKG